MCLEGHYEEAQEPELKFDQEKNHCQWLGLPGQDGVRGRVCRAVAPIYSKEIISESFGKQN